MLQATHFTRSGSRAIAPGESGMLALAEDSIVDSIVGKFKSIFSPSTPQPPSVACAHGTNIDPETGAALDASGTCVCPFGTAWSDDEHRCTETAGSDAAAASAAAGESVGAQTLRSCIQTGFGVAFCVKNHPEITRDDIQTVFPGLNSGDLDSLLTAVQSVPASSSGAQPIDIARMCIRGAGSFASCTAGLQQNDVNQLAQEFPTQAAASPPVTAAAPGTGKKKFVDVKNPMFWVAVAAGAAVVIGGGYLIFRSPKPAAATKTAVVPALPAPAAKAAFARRSRRSR